MRSLRGARGGARPRVGRHWPTSRIFKDGSRRDLARGEKVLNDGSKRSRAVDYSTSFAAPSAERIGPGRTGASATIVNLLRAHYCSLRATSSV